MRYVPVSREEHHGKHLKPVPNFAHAAGMAATEVVIGEIAQVTASYPMFFVEQEGNAKLIAMMGLSQGENLQVDISGNWMGFYIPAVIRSYPFSLGQTTQNGEVTVLIDEDSQLLSDYEGEPLFGTEEGEPDGPVARAIKLLTQVSIEGGRTMALAGQLKQAGLLKPTALNIERKGVKQDFGGISTIDEAALNALPDDQFLALRRSGALLIAYAQLYSLGQLGRLQARANLRDQGIDSSTFS